MGGGNELEYGVLGPLEVRRDGVPLALGGAKPRALLADLLLNANQVVSTDRLIDDLWGDSPPATAQTTLQVYVLQLRRLLEPEHEKGVSYEVLVTAPPGYSIRVPAAALDLGRFERLAADGLQALARGDPHTASGSFAGALGLWRGAAVADLAYASFAQGAIARLEELRLEVLEKRIEAELACGRHTGLVAELQELTAAHPMREGLAAHLMLALYRSGRQAEALEVYQRTRDRLVDELGIDPSPSLQRLERSILMQDAALDLDRRLDAQGLPRGTVALLLTDIEGSTVLLSRLGEDYADLLAEHRRLLRDAVATNEGHEVDRSGDGFFFVFEHAAAAARAATAAQRACAAHAWPGGVEVRVRMGLHVGAPDLAEEGYVGLDVHRAARICAAGHGGQVLLSGPAADAVRAAKLPDVDLVDLGRHELSGLDVPEPIFQLVTEGLRSEFPPLRPSRQDAAGPNRAVLVVAEDDAALSDLVSLVEPLGRGARAHELILARLVEPSRGNELEAIVATAQAHREELVARNVVTRVAAFTSADTIADVVRLASRTEVDLLALAAPDVRADGLFGDELAGILRETLCDVCFLVQEPAGSSTGWLEGPVYVPFGGATHDWAALELGAWLAGNSDRPLHLLGTQAEVEGGGRDASRLLADAGLLIQRASGVTPVPKLVGPGREGTVDAAAGGGLLVIGLSERWAEEGLGATRWGIVRSTATPVLFVRRGLRPGGLAPDASATRFAWSVTIGA